ncbi:unnamed protein product [Urochloa humidicola]
MFLASPMSSSSPALLSIPEHSDLSLAGAPAIDLQLAVWRSRPSPPAVKEATALKMDRFGAAPIPWTVPRVITNPCFQMLLMWILALQSFCFSNHTNAPDVDFFLPIARCYFNCLCS